MNSSTSNSKRTSFGWVLLGLLLLLAGLELLTRRVFYPLSLDYAPLHAYPGKARALASSKGFKLALLGNSALAEGVDSEQLAQLISSQSGKTTQAAAFTADASEIITWQAMAQDLFWREQALPDQLVVTYFGNRLQDQADVQIGRIAQFFTQIEDWPELFRTQFRDSSSRIEFLTSSLWASYAARERIKQRALGLVVPKSRDLDKTLAVLSHKYGTQPKATPSYSSLAHFLATAKHYQVPVILVVFPSRATQTIIDPELRSVVSQYGAVLLDMQPHAQIPADQYRDGIHLLPEGRKAYTEKLAQQLTPLLKLSPP